MGLSDFTGETGGLIAATWITAWSLGWLACVKIRVNPLQSRVEKVEKENEAFMANVLSRFWGER